MFNNYTSDNPQTAEHYQTLEREEREEDEEDDYEGD
jgi:hypothetical protein